MNQFCLPPGNVGGLVFERVVGKAFTVVEKFTYHDCTGASTDVPLGKIGAEVTTAKSPPSSVNSVPDDTCLSTPQMTGCDFLLKVEKRVYFIQCTTGDVGKKCGFWKDAPAGAISLLVTPLCNNGYAKQLKSQKSELAFEFKEDKFKLLDASLIPADDLEYFLK